MGEAIDTGDIELWTERRGRGPAVLLIAGLGDPAEAWQSQLDGLSESYLVSAFDNRGVGRTPLPERQPLSACTMADDAAALLRALEIPSAHVAGYSMGSAIAQEMALRHPELVRSLVLVSTYARPDALWRSQLDFWRWLPEVAPSERAFFEGFFTWVYTPRAHADGTVDQLVEEALAFPHKQSVEAFQAQVDVCLAHDTVDRLPKIAAPTLVLSGELDIILPPRFGRSVAAAIPNARFEAMAGEAHQPFQEVPEEFNARVEDFWREVEARG
ncbi:MAG TPA: alpha/beta hydrolase [Rubrobacteraceae bacterium]|nr:alpha/beta hydrolase [Rubrobacteraceae bacterium]